LESAAVFQYTSNESGGVWRGMAEFGVPKSLFWEKLDSKFTLLTSQDANKFFEILIFT